MSRAKRREGRGSARSRRTPARAAASGGPRIPWVPLGVVVGIAVVAGIIALLVWQQGGEEGSQFAAAAEIEADPAPDLPGEFVNLQEIYDGEYGAHGENPTAAHVTRDVDYIADGNTNPPAGGAHWGRSACTQDPDDAPPFCGPAPWGVYRKPWEPETVVHNMEHGGVVLWYNTTDQSIIDELEDLVEDRLDGNELLVLMPYFEMEEEHIALTAWARLDKYPVSEYSKDRVEEFIDAFKCRFNPEGVGGSGC